MASQTRTDARFSTYSGAPSIQPSLAPTFETSTTSAQSSNRNTTTSQHLTEKHASQQNSHQSTHLSPKPTAPSSDFYAQRPGSSTTINNDPKTADIKSWSDGFDRMTDQRLDAQRYVMDESKSDEVSKLALGAKLERALGRRMVGQDASFSKRGVVDEKGRLEVEAH